MGKRNRVRKQHVDIVAMVKAEKSIYEIMGTKAPEEKKDERGVEAKRSSSGVHLRGNHGEDAGASS